MNVFELRTQLVSDYANFVRAFIHIKDDRINDLVDHELAAGLLWPDPLIQLNPSFEPGEWIDDLVAEGTLHEGCRRVFRIKPDPPEPDRPLRLHRHQADAVRVARSGFNYVLTTGTGSGKSLSYIIPIVDHVLRTGSGRGIQAIIVYPMNALANSQVGELTKFLQRGFPDRRGPVTFARYTGQESEEEREGIKARPPDILLTNFVMLELILTRPFDRAVVNAAQGLRFLVLDELHTYRGRQGADVAMLARRVREALQADRLQFVGTSATVAGIGTYDEQRAQVADVATRLFGAAVQSEHVIGETLRRSTPGRDLSDERYMEELRRRLEDGSPPPTDYRRFVEDPLSVWIESTLGPITEPDTGRLVRSKPRSVSGPEGAAAELTRLTGVSDERCNEAIGRQLLASYGSAHNPDTGFPVFAFRLHQFISRGDTVYATVEPESRRHVTVYGQQFVPGNRERGLLPLVFCRECGQEYYCVRANKPKSGSARVFTPRELSDRLDDDESFPGFLYVNTVEPWPESPDAVIERLPDDWIEEHGGKQRVRRDRRDYLPKAVRVAPDGSESDSGTDCHFIRAPFRFCLHCGLTYDFRQRSDFGKLSSLATEGRSTATTVLSLSAIRYLRTDELLSRMARKLLSFTDNRQDASLQAGHFNDFIEIGLLRSALFRAVAGAGKDGIRHDELTQRVFDALDLPLELYANDPEVRFQALEDTKRALRSVLAYRLYRDLKRGWRITSPNLEQCGLLEIHYMSLPEVCHAEDIWEPYHPALASATPETRQKVAKTLLDLMRRELAIKVDVLQQAHQERIVQQSSQRLIDPWALDDSEDMETAFVLYPRSRRPTDYRGYVYLSPRGGFGQYLRRSDTLPEIHVRLSLQDTETICRQLLEALRAGGLVEVVSEVKGDDEVAGYQLPASALLWTAGDGTRAFHDPIRVPRASTLGARTNRFFIEFYRAIAGEGKGLEAREHTAQVDAKERQKREERFREGRLPILYCSPTMELGVDIAELNAVNLRNIPPTPANYAQRSGRAGRSGQPALVFSYCSTYSQHDQYFFRHPDYMVGGAVTPPRLDLANEDLLRAHVHAIWLSTTGLHLGTSLVQIVDVDGEEPSLELRAQVRDEINRQAPRDAAKQKAHRVLASIQSDLANADWYSDRWLDELLNQVALSFDHTCDRWRGLYRAAAQQRALQHGISIDNSRTAEDRRKAKRLRAEAEAQIELLIGVQSAIEADFYSYRYFASEGFLPGYNFPRLPLSAFIPGRRGRIGRDEFLSRPRFLAISEFGPRSILYHEGARYRINRVILSIEPTTDGERVVTTSAKQCTTCGYLHPVTSGEGPDLCEQCGTILPMALGPLFRLQNVSTKRTERINSDEDERLRVGYELKTGVRFAERGGHLSVRTALVKLDGQDIATIRYGDAATLWRINLGWARRANRNQLGFMLDLERGFWARNEQDVEDQDDPLSTRQQRVIPFVEDRRNCLLVEPVTQLDDNFMTSLQAALKNAIQVEYQIEDQELATEALPSRDDRRSILLYEAAEGGAGVLRRLVDDSGALRHVAAQGLQLCHFDPRTGEDLRRAPGAREDCEAACYDCLMSYTNQPDHRMLDRHAVRDFLMQLTQSTVVASPAAKPRAEHLSGLMNQCDSELEREWLRFIDGHALRLPSGAQVFVEACRTRPDFTYRSHLTAVYVDGPAHEYSERQARDRAQTECMEDHGYTVIRFGHKEDWGNIIARHPNIFGKI